MTFKEKRIPNDLMAHQITTYEIVVDVMVTQIVTLHFWNAS